jgi:hypothetical protein
MELFSCSESQTVQNRNYFVSLGTMAWRSEVSEVTYWRGIPGIRRYLSTSHVLRTVIGPLYKSIIPAAD